MPSYRIPHPYHISRKWRKCWRYLPDYGSTHGLRQVVCVNMSFLCICVQLGIGAIMSKWLYTYIVNTFVLYIWLYILNMFASAICWDGWVNFGIPWMDRWSPFWTAFKESHYQCKSFTKLLPDWNTVNTLQWVIYYNTTWRTDIF